MSMIILGFHDACFDSHAALDTPAAEYVQAWNGADQSLAETENVARDSGNSLEANKLKGKYNKWLVTQMELTTQTHHFILGMIVLTLM